MNIREKGYKAVSASAATIENVAKPAVKHSHKIMIEGSRQIHGGIEGLKKLNRGIHKLVKYSIHSDYQNSLQNLKIIEQGLNSHQTELEAYFNQNNIDVHHNWAFSSENRETIRELSLYIKENTKDCKEIPYHRLWQYLIAFACIQKKARQNLWKIEKIETKDFLQIGLREMKYFCRYAVGIYGKLLVRVIIEKKWGKIFQSESDEEILQKYAKIHPENLIYSHIKSKKYLPAHAICIDLPSKSIVLAIRGTMSVFDCMTDLKGDYTTHDYTDPMTGEVIASGLVHSGIFACAKNLSLEIKPRILAAFEQFPRFSLVISGHSLGAGASALLALIWMSDAEIVSHSFRAFAYAPPAVVSADLNVHLQKYVFSSVFGNDLVSRLSFGAIRDLCETVKFFHNREKSNQGVKASEITSNFMYGNEFDDAKMIQLYTDVKECCRSYKLQPPGNVFQIYQKKRHSDFELLASEETKEYVGEFVDPSFHDEIAFSKTTLTDHMPNFYENGLNYLAGEPGVYSQESMKTFF